MQSLAQSWLVYDMTKSPLALGVVTAMWGIPILTFSFLGGTLADRVSKRKLIMIAESSNAVISLVVALLILSHRITVWQLMAAALLSGIVVSFNIPARQALIPELVRKNELLNAIALYATGQNLSRIVGPALAGVLITLIGVESVYLMTVVLCLTAVGSIWRIPISGNAIRKVEGSLWSGAKEGIAYVKDSHDILGLLTLLALVTLFAMPYPFILPIFAADILKVGPAELGYLNAMVGIGALVGALVVASASNLHRKGLTMIGMAILLGLMLSLFAFSRLYPLSLALLFGVGIGNQGYTSLNNALLQIHSAIEMRGRVMSLTVATFGFTQVGALPMGAVAEVVGAPVALGGSAILVIAAILGLTAWRPQLKVL